MSRAFRVGAAEGIAEGEVRAYELDGTWVAVVRSEGSLHAFLDECTHGECPLSKGSVEDGQIECDCHGAMFDVRTGAVTRPPATRPIPVYPVHVDGGEIVVTLPS
jgi:3-phenylpropionate/trans-cinnamate dioxygenase ferredoxin subunit